MRKKKKGGGGGGGANDESIVYTMDVSSGSEAFALYKVKEENRIELYTKMEKFLAKHLN